MKKRAESSSDAVTGIIIRWFSTNPEGLKLLDTYGPKACQEVAEEVGGFYNDLEEIGSSDRWAFIDSAKKHLVHYPKKAKLMKAAKCLTKIIAAIEKQAAPKKALEKAFEFGSKSKEKDPALDKDLTDLIKSVGMQHTMELMQAWFKGFKNRAATSFKDYKQEHPGTKKTPSDPMFKRGLDQYKHTALWSSTDDDGTPLDKHHSHEDFDPNLHQKMEKDWKAFSQKHRDMVDKYGPEKVAHDFWLTRNGHGAGFWDGDYDDKDGKMLTESAKKFGQHDIYKGDDGMIYG